jgi:penicillin-binding protein 1A
MIKYNGEVIKNMAQTERRQNIEKVTASKKKRKRPVLRWLFFMVVTVCLVAAVIGGSILKAYIDEAPPLDLAKIEEQSETSFFYDIEGNPIAEYFGYENRIWATIEEIPDKLENAFIAIEDKRFREHKGLDFRRLAGAVINNLTGGRLQGASTITQQLVRNCFLSLEQTYKRKIQEAYLSIQLEREYNKDQILEAYLNTINFGEGNYGVKAAAKDYFGKENLEELTLKECAVLAAIPKSPTRYNPRKNYNGAEENPTEERAQLVLKEMLESGFITQDEYEAAVQEKVVVNMEATRLKLYDMAPFIEYALYEVRDALIKVKGWNDDEEGRQKAEEYIYSSGLKIYTTLDRQIQKAVEDTLYNWDKYPSTAEEADAVKVSGDTKLPQPQAAAVVIDYHTGYIQAVVGGRTPPTRKRELNRATSPVMVGSTIKPIAVYGPALDLGKSPASIYHNIPVTINGWDPKQKFPKNYGGGGYTGPTSMRYGLKKSLNIVAAQALTYDVGFETSRNYLGQLGINTELVSANGSSLALGTSSITPVEMAAAYSAIANGGVYIEPISVLKVVDREGNVIIDRTKNQVKRRVFKESTAWLLTDMMKDAVKSGTAKNAKIAGITVAGKTGTNSDYKGVTFAGFTPYYAGFVWIGHDEGKPLSSDAQGGSYAAPLWQAFMARIHQEKGLGDKPIIDKEPEELGLVKKKICNISGKLAGPNCPPEDVIYDWFTSESVPSEICDRHAVIQICADSRKFPNEYCPEESIINKVVYFLEPDSPYRQLSQDQLAKWLPEAYTSFNSQEEIMSLDPQNPQHAGYFCDIHTAPEIPDSLEEWNESLDDVWDYFDELFPGKDNKGNNKDNNDNNGNNNGNNNNGNNNGNNKKDKDDKNYDEFLPSPEEEGETEEDISSEN